MRALFIVALILAGCGAAGGSGPTYAHDGDSCRTDADCTPAPEDEVVRAWCSSDGTCEAATSVELER